MSGPDGRSFAAGPLEKLAASGGNVMADLHAGVGEVAHPALSRRDSVKSTGRVAAPVVEKALARRSFWSRGLA